MTSARYRASAGTGYENFRLDISHEWHPEAARALKIEFRRKFALLEFLGASHACTLRRHTKIAQTDSRLDRRRAGRIRL